MRCVARVKGIDPFLSRARAALASQPNWLVSCCSLRARHTYFADAARWMWRRCVCLCVCWVVECGIFLFCFSTKKHRIQSERSMVRVRLINLFLLLVLVKVGRFVFFVFLSDYLRCDCILMHAIYYTHLEVCVWVRAILAGVFYELRLQWFIGAESSVLFCFFLVRNSI